uniref:Uncharacterized protein n=1 Tax=Meloidogyne incognita TaxID=6306 RepID=A0A914NR01_MELIC
MNGNVYDYGNYVLSNFGSKSIQEIVEEDGAIAMIGPDMNLEGKLLLAKNIQFLPVTPESCSIHTVDIKINNVTIEKEISCVSFLRERINSVVGSWEFFGYPKPKNQTEKSSVLR